VDVQIVDNSVGVESSWLDLVRTAASAAEPVAVGLPVPGDPAGVPVGVLATISVDSGVVAINRTQVLCQDSNAEWILMNETNNVLHYDLSQTRRSLMEQISESANQLAASDLVGDETEILAALESFRTLHLPPSLTKRSVDALELASRVIIIASGAIKSATAVHSPSIDQQRLKVLQSLIKESRSVLQSVVAF
jgi:hypothetical protein